jgi:glycosyltransferase involved in cell wall biosynthesis
MKIVQLLPEFNEGGVERGVLELSRELVKKGFESIIISNGGKLVNVAKSEGALHVKLDVCSKNPLSAPWRIYKLYKILQKINPDILHVRSRIPAWMVFFANKYLGKTVISTVHGFNSVSFYSSIMTRANHIICVSGAIKEYIQQHYNTLENKITIIPRGIDLEKFNPQNVDKQFIQEFKNKFDLHDKFIVTTVGRITQLKDLETFIHAIALVQQENPNVIGLIVGGVRDDKQNYFKSLQELIKSLDVNVVFTGSQEKVAEIYFLSDVVISASKKPESFGRSVAEAIALGTPVIATNHGGVKDIIKEGINGYLVSIQSPNELHNQILITKKLKFDGFDYIATNFSLEQMVEKTIKIYKTFISKLGE